MRDYIFDHFDLYISHYPRSILVGWFLHQNNVVRDIGHLHPFMQQVFYKQSAEYTIFVSGSQ